MGFKQLSLREIIFITMAGLIFICVIISKLFLHASIPEQNTQMETALDPKSESRSLESNHGPDMVLTDNITPLNETTEEDNQSMKEMKEQIDSDRLQQKKIKMLKLQLEQTNLQLEQDKALSEITKLEKLNAGVVNDASEQGQDKYPDVKVIYIGGTDDKKEAILSINGSNYSVKEKNKPVKNLQVDSITDTYVTVHFFLPQDLTATIEYKPE